MSRKALLAGVERAIAAYRDKKLWRQLQRNGMARDFSWEASAAQYLALYESLGAGLEVKYR
jgi:starch synthase